MSLIGGKIETKLYLEMLRLQHTSLPSYAVKMRFAENHDVSRIMEVALTREKVFVKILIYCTIIYNDTGNYMDCLSCI